MKTLRFSKLDDQVFELLRKRPQSVEELGKRLDGVTIGFLESLKRLKDSGLIYVSARGQDDKGRPIAIYDVTRTRKTVTQSILAYDKGEMRVTPV